MTNNDGDAETHANMDGVDVAKVSEKPVQAQQAADNSCTGVPRSGPDRHRVTSLTRQCRSVAENMDGEPVGGPISATDTDGDALLFTVSGDDAASFKTDDNGQISTKVKLDYETKDTYMVMLTAIRPVGRDGQHHGDRHRHGRER